MNILIVDDEFVSRKKMQKIMQKYGHCDAASDGKEAFDAFLLAHKEKSPYDLITMDIEMPEMNGIETLKKIRGWEEKNRIPFGTGVKIVMVTVSTGMQTVHDSFYEGCEAYVVKPFDSAKIEKALVQLGFSPAEND